MNLLKITMATLTVAIFAFGCKESREEKSFSNNSPITESTIFG
ncbi:MAG: hypothetical protein ACPGVD_12040 [Flavobacteriales bacterium]